jgi:hypothetical protein
MGFPFASTIYPLICIGKYASERKGVVMRYIAKGRTLVYGRRVEVDAADLSFIRTLDSHYNFTACFMISNGIP